MLEKIGITLDIVCPSHVPRSESWWMDTRVYEFHGTMIPPEYMWAWFIRFLGLTFSVHGVHKV